MTDVVTLTVPKVDVEDHSNSPGAPDDTPAPERLSDGPPGVGSSLLWVRLAPACSVWCAFWLDDGSEERGSEGYIEDSRGMNVLLESRGSAVLVALACGGGTELPGLGSAE